MSELVEKAERLAARAYAPYSNYLVGAVVRARDGREFEGVNVENAAYPLGICAEKNAIAAAVAAGCRPGDLEAIGITASPCGGCRQWLYEFRIDEVAYRGEDGAVRTTTPGRAPAGRLEPPRMKSGFVAVAGRPNVGKSTLVNSLIGEKVAIVSRIPHTTRHRIRGVWTGTTGAGATSPEVAQLVLVDLPGWQKPIDMLTERMQDRVEETIADDLDVVLFVVNARERIGAGDRYVARRVFDLGVPVVIVVNKVDRLKASHIATQMKAVASLGDFHALHPVSAKTGDGHRRAPLRSRLAAPRGAALLPDGEVTDMPLEARIAELVREQALRLTKEEVPHSLTAEVIEIDDQRVHVRLYTETESQKHDPDRQGRLGRARDRPLGAPRDRGAARPHDLPRAAGQGLAQVAPERDDARTARALAQAWKS